jgi:large conductance mechanosensitive channel
MWSTSQSARIVKSLVADAITQPIGLALGGVDFTNLFITLEPTAEGAVYSSLAAAQEAGAVKLN